LGCKAEAAGITPGGVRVDGTVGCTKAWLPSTTADDTRHHATSGMFFIIFITRLGLDLLPRKDTASDLKASREVSDAPDGYL
jgi:hypothetical protein